MRCRNILRLAFIMLASLILLNIAFAFAANNVVPVTHLTNQSSAVTADSLKPPACAGITLTAILYCPPGGGTCKGTDASELVLGSAGNDDIDSGKGNDCILGAGGNDSLKGEQNTDVCMGGQGTDSFHPSCETQIQ